LPLVIAVVPSSEWPLLAHLNEADDFLSLPAHPGETLTRLSFLLQKRRGIAADDVLSIEGVAFDLANYSVRREGETLDLTFKEYELLRFLATHRGRVFTRETLLQQVWGYDFYGGARTVDVHIRRLRAKLGASHDYLIETVRNVGYRFYVK
jgi:DNA-binding response OmpR family regulator